MESAIRAAQDKSLDWREASSNVKKWTFCLEISQDILANLPWGHNLALISKVPEREKRVLYAHQSRDAGVLVALCLLGNKSRVEAGNTFPDGGALRSVINSSLRGLVGSSIRLHFDLLAARVIALGLDGLWFLDVNDKDPTAIGSAIEDLL